MDPEKYVKKEIDVDYIGVHFVIWNMTTVYITYVRFLLSYSGNV